MPSVNASMYLLYWMKVDKIKALVTMYVDIFYTYTNTFKINICQYQQQMFYLLNHSEYRKLFEITHISVFMPNFFLKMLEDA